MGERLTPLFPKYRCPLICQMLKPSQLTVKVHPPLATSRGQHVDVAVTGAADGTVHCTGSATYQICFRLLIPNPNPNPNPKSN